MTEYEIYDWLKKQHINVPEYKVFELAEALDVAFFPVALKISSPNIIHKSDVGGIAINLENNEQLNKAKETILTNIKQHHILLNPQTDKFLVTHMHKGIELFFGIVNDPVFEKVLVFGSGGTFAELFKDICFIDSEADEDEIEKAIDQTKIGRLFTKGFRGEQYNIQLIIDFIKKLQQLEVQEMDLNPVILSKDALTVVDARLIPITNIRNHKAIKQVPELFSPQKVAIIGVSSHPEKIGYALAQNTAHLTDVFFVNPKMQQLLDKQVFNCIEALPLVDTAVLAIPPSTIEETVLKLIDKKVKNIIIITAGFKETGRDEEFLTRLASTYDLNIVGPNCLGIYANGMNLTFGTQDIQKGQVNLFSQSGAIVAELMDKAALKKIGFENIVSVGNMADVDFGDLISSYPGNHPINLYIEGISHGKNLLRAMRKSQSQIKIFKAGKSEVAQKAAFSHTGNMAGNYNMFMSLVKSTGALIVKDVNGLLYPYQFNRVLIITNAGGAGTVMSDLINDKLYPLGSQEIEQLSEVLPPHWSKNNPIDIIGDASKERYLKALQVSDTFGADAIYVIVTPQFMTHPENVCKIFTECTFKTKVLPVLLGGELMEGAKVYLQNNKIDFFEELTEAVSFL